MRALHLRQILRGVAETIHVLSWISAVEQRLVCEHGRMLAFLVCLRKLGALRFAQVVRSRVRCSDRSAKAQHPFSHRRGGGAQEQTQLASLPNIR